MSTYFDNLCTAMEMLSKHPKTMFMGQAVEYPGTAMYNTLKHVPMEKRLELPVFEDCQLGMAIGMSLNGCIPICIYPRINFLLLAINQLVNHLDKLPLYSGYKPKVIIRTAVAHNQPMDPGVQHLGDYSNAIDDMLTTVRTLHIIDPRDTAVGMYEYALREEGSFLIVEYLEKYQ